MKTNNLLKTLSSRFTDMNFTANQSFYWSPANKTVYYDSESMEDEKSSWSLLHELSHGLLGHTTYRSDFELLKFEVEAWKKAKQLSKEFELSIDEDHIEDCLNTYRDWLYSRSTCPSCTLNSLQVSKTIYKCLNCDASWKVSPSRFCRPYRKIHN